METTINETKTHPFYRKTITHFVHYTSDDPERQMVLEERIKTVVVIAWLIRIETITVIDQSYGKKLPDKKLGF